MRVTIVSLLLCLCVSQLWADGVQVPELVPAPQLQISFAYHLPDTPLPAQVQPLAWIEQQAVDVTLTNTGKTDLSLHLLTVELLETNGLPVPAIVIDRTTAPIAITLSGGQAKTVTIYPEGYGFAPQAGHPYFLKTTWLVSDANKTGGMVERMVPYILPETAPVYTSAWVEQDGISARLLLTYQDSAGYPAVAIELRNQNAYGVSFGSTPWLLSEITQDGNTVAPSIMYADYLRMMQPFTLPPTATITLPSCQASVDHKQQLFILPLESSIYHLTPGAYQLTATLTAESEELKKTYTWKLPAFTFIVPPISEVQP